MGVDLLFLASYVNCPFYKYVMFSRDYFRYLSENSSFLSTCICLNLKEIILKGIIMWSEMEKQTTEAKEV